MAASMQTFEVWLTDKLLKLNPETDTDVFVTYINGILEEDVPQDEKLESLVDLIGQVVEDNVTAVCDELFKKWEEMSGVSTQNTSDAEKLTDHLASILDKQKIETVKPKEKSAEEIERKRAILEHYQEVASGDEDDEGGTDDPGGHKGHTTGQGDNFLSFKNTNADSVKQIEQEKREKSKQEAEKKKERDKQEREAQKQKQKDRKEQEKKRTQKGERRR